MQPKDNENWFRTDEIEEFISAIEFCAFLTNHLANNWNYWKWLIVAAHNALQGIFVCALRGIDTTGTSMLTKKSSAEVWHWLNVESREPSPPSCPKEQLAPMLDLYKRVRSKRYMDEECCLPTHQQMNKDIIKLNFLRNEFSHFTPKGFSVETSGLPRIISHCCDIFEYLAIEHPTFWHHLNEARRTRIKNAVDAIRANLR